MSKILALWATPRSTSTVFEKVMANRGDMRCFHESYNEAYYYGADRRNDRYYSAEPGLPIKQHLTHASVHRDMTALAESESIFIKDFAYSIMHMADDAFLDAFTHTFLIRDPEKVITSLHARWPDVILPEIGFEELHTLYNRITDREGKAPVVIDSDELLQSPVSGMKTYCESVGIPFIADALQWDKSNENPTWNNDEHGFHDALKSSTTLAPQKRHYPALESNPDMLRLYEASLPHYQALYEKRVRFDS